MVRHSRYLDRQEDLNVWPAFTDLMANAFMIFGLLLLLATLKSASSQINQKIPPIIIIEDEKSYRFASGSAEIPPQMDNYIREKIVPEIEKNAQQYRINVVEVIGHTDGQPRSTLESNLDLNIEKAASGEMPVTSLEAGSNADLGLTRAVAVVRVLRDLQSQPGRLKGLNFRAYSAAQLILPNGKFASVDREPDQTRRRIEIRFTRLGTLTKVK
jgi:flagellar motor protein MotB